MDHIAQLLVVATVTPPHPPLLLRVATRSVFFWLLIRVMYALVLIFGAQQVGLVSADDARQFAIHPMWPARLLLVGLTAFMVHVDRARAHEHLLQANFGVGAAWFAAVSLVAASVSDLVVQTLLLTI